MRKSRLETRTEPSSERESPSSSLGEEAKRFGVGVGGGRRRFIEYAGGSTVVVVDLLVGVVGGRGVARLLTRRGRVVVDGS